MEQNLITVTQTVTEKLPADMFEIAFTATGEDKKYAEASDKAEKAADATLSALIAAGFDVRVTGVGASPVRDGKKAVGYRARRSFSVRAAYTADALSSALEALSLSACEWELSFYLKSTPDRVLERAVTAARAKAETVARAAGVSLSAVSRIEYSSSDCVPRLMTARAFAFGQSAPEPEDITVSETVTVSWTINP